MIMERTTRIVVDNLVCYDSGDSLANIVNPAAGY